MFFWIWGGNGSAKDSVVSFNSITISVCEPWCVSGKKYKSISQRPWHVQQTDRCALVANTISISKHFSPRMARRFLKAIVTGRSGQRWGFLLNRLRPWRIIKYRFYIMSSCLQSGGGNTHFEISFFGTTVAGRSCALWKVPALPPCVAGCPELRRAAEGLSGPPVTRSAPAFDGRWRYLPYTCHREGMTDKIVSINHRVLCRCGCRVFAGDSGLKLERWEKACSISSL